METLRARLAELNTQVNNLCKVYFENRPTIDQELEMDKLYGEIFAVEEQMRELDPLCLPTPGSWADIARTMAASDNGESGMDWDAWKDEMKELSYE